jgi:hypothetical protein
MIFYKVVKKSLIDSSHTLLKILNPVQKQEVFIEGAC